MALWPPLRPDQKLPGVCAPCGRDDHAMCFGCVACGCVRSAGWSNACAQQIR